MTKSLGLPDVVGQIYSLLEPLESADRQKVVKSAMTLLGEETGGISGSKAQKDAQSGEDNNEFGIKASRWMTQNGISMTAIEELFHKEGEHVEIIANEIPGEGKRGMTQNCYLLSGVRALLESDEPKFSDADAVALCKHMGCYNSPNHAKTRSDLGNIVAGTKSSGFTLAAPGLRAAASLVKNMVTGS